MSYLNELQLYKDVQQTPEVTSLESINFGNLYNECLSMEAEGVSAMKQFMDKMDSIFERLIFKIGQIIDWIKEKALKFVDWFLRRPTGEKLHELVKKGVLKEGDIRTAIARFARTNKNVYVFIFDKDGQIHDVYKSIRVLKEAIDNYGEDSMGTMQAMRESLNLMTDKLLTHKDVKLDKLFIYADNLQKVHNDCEQFYNQYGKKLSDKIKELHRVIDRKSTEGKLEGKMNNTMDLEHKAAYYRNLVFHLMMPMNCIVQYIRLMEFLRGDIQSGEYVTTDKLNPKHLYHLSPSSSLPDVMKPRIGGTNYTQILPSRVSFCEEVLKCCHGTPRLFANIDGIPMSQPTGAVDKTKDLWFKDLWLYEGKPTSETRYVKEEVIRVMVGEQFFSEEIAVTTPIEVKRLGKIRITFTGNTKPISSDGILPVGKFHKWEFVEKDED